MAWFPWATTRSSKKEEKRKRREAQYEADRLRAELEQARSGGAVGPGGQTQGSSGMSASEYEAEIARLAREVEERDKRFAEEGWKEGEELFAKDVRGLTPEQRSRIEKNAQMRLNRSLQGTQRDVLASQGKSGIRGAAAYAQQRDIENLGRQAQGDFYRELEEYDPELALKKLAMMFNIQQGRRSMGHMNRQQAIDELRMREESKRQRDLENALRNQFGRI